MAFNQIPSWVIEELRKLRIGGEDSSGHDSDRGEARNTEERSDGDDDAEEHSDEEYGSDGDDDSDAGENSDGDSDSDKGESEDDDGDEYVAKGKFNREKKKLAIDLLTELDRAVTDSEISSLTAKNGGVQIIWSNKLRSTAGRAKMFRIPIKSASGPFGNNNSNGNSTGSTFQYSASIELAEKVVDSQDRLVSRLEHEFCHLANCMIRNVLTPEHGKSFFAWAAKVTEHLQSTNNKTWRRVFITEKHDYEIAYKYVWACIGQGCGVWYSRHSESIIPTQHRCGRCNGRLRQVKP